MNDRDPNETRRHVRIGPRRMPVPRAKLPRMLLGAALVAGGMLGFLPVLGFWMIPLGILVLAHDIPAARRLERAGRRRVVRMIRRWRARRRC
jgi:hypothetical protein